MTWIVRITEGSGKRGSRITKLTPMEVSRAIGVVFPDTTVTAEWVPSPGDSYDWYLDRLRQDVIDDRMKYFTDYSGLSFARMVMQFRDMVFKYANEKIPLHDAVQFVMPLYNELKEH